MLFSLPCTWLVVDASCDRQPGTICSLVRSQTCVAESLRLFVLFGPAREGPAVATCILQHLFHCHVI